MTKTKIFRIKIFTDTRNQYCTCIFDNTDDDITHDTVDTEEGRDNRSALFFVITSHQLTHCFGGNSTNNSNSSVTAAESSCWGQKMLLLLVRVKMSLRRWRNRFLATLSLILLTTLLTLHHTLHAMLGIFGWCKPISTSQIFTPTTSLVTTQQIYKCELKYFE